MLSIEQKLQLRRDGFLHLKGAVSPQLVDAALRVINAQLGRGFSAELAPKFGAEGWFPESSSRKEITDLYNASSVGETIAHLLGGHGRTLDGAQLALRFPREKVPDTPRLAPPHLDGVGTSANGIAVGKLSTFSALAGVFLTPVRAPFAGNFCVWPGSHLVIQEFLQTHGAPGLLREGQTPPLDFGEGLQLEVEPGDAVIAHYQLMHGVAMNLAPHPRFAAFFRVMHPDHQLEDPTLLDVWQEWPGLQS